MMLLCKYAHMLVLIPVGVLEFNALVLKGAKFKNWPPVKFILKTSNL